MSFNSLGLSDGLVENVAARGYTQATPIQKQAIPAVIAGNDILAGAQTGTGKTAAFALPIIHTMLDKPRSTRGKPRLRCLVITPTRELAAQVGESFVHYGRGTGLQTGVIFGGVGQNPQVSAIRRGTDILVATPGRLLDLNQQGFCSLNTVDILVLDEADRMLDMGFIHDIRKILKMLPVQRQNLMFSATYSEEIRKLASNFLVNPVLIDVAPRNAAADRVNQSAYSISKGMKRALLSQLIRDNNWYQVLVFTRTKHGANRLAKQLGNDGIASAAIHGNKSQAARTQALGRFKRGDLQALVATDIAARGLDIRELACVVNFELPNVPEDYVHRIGRTGRAGKEGLAISLFCDEEDKYLRGIERLLKKPIRRAVYGGKIEVLATDQPFESGSRSPSRESNRSGRQDRNERNREETSPVISPDRNRGVNRGPASAGNRPRNPSRRESWEAGGEPRRTAGHDGKGSSRMNRPSRNAAHGKPGKPSGRRGLDSSSGGGRKEPVRGTGNSARGRNDGPPRRNRRRGARK